MILEPYLFFYGKCEEALTFYKDVFDGEIVSMMRFEGSPMESQVAPEFKKGVMHATFKSPTVEFMASDGNPSRKFDSGNISLSLATEDENEAQRVFGKLAEGGEVTMPLQAVFWGGTFGTLTDRYGIDWMVSCGHNGA
jgi:PhnB protein